MFGSALDDWSNTAYLAGMTQNTHDTKDTILARGEALMLQHGFAGVGLSAVLKAAGVPKGSFYHYFSSKEDFGREVIEAYSDRYTAALDKLLDQQTTAADRLTQFLNAWSEGQGGRCLVVKLGAEVSDLAEPMRAAMNRGVDGFTQRLADLLDQGARDGTLQVADPLAEAQTLYAALLGAAVLTRLSGDPTALRRVVSDTKHRLIRQP